MGGKNTSDWYPAARQMRLSGATRRQIAQAFGKSMGSVDAAIKGIKCPIDHKRMNDDSRRFKLIEEARELRRAHFSYGDIAKRLKCDKTTVIKYTKDIDAQAPMNYKKDPASVAKGVATRKALRDQAILEGRIVPKSERPKPAYKRRKPTDIPIEEIRRRQRHRLIVRGMQGRSAPVTLAGSIKGSSFE